MRTLDDLDVEGKRVLVLAKDCPSEGALSGTVGPYEDPDSRCSAHTAFQGTLRGGTIAGTFRTECLDGLDLQRLGRRRFELRQRVVAGGNELGQLCLVVGLHCLQLGLRDGRLGRLGLRVSRGLSRGTHAEGRDAALGRRARQGLQLRPGADRRGRR